MAVSSVTLSNTLKLYRADRYTVARAIGLSDLLRVSPGLARLYRMPTTLRSTLRVSSTFSAKAKLGMTLRSTLGLRGQLSRGQAMVLRSTLRLSPHLTVAQALLLQSLLKLTPRRSVAARYGATLRSVLRLTPLLGKPGAALALFSTLRVSGNLTKTYRAIAALQAQLHLTSSLTPKLSVVVLLNGRLRLTPTQALRGIFHGTLRDTVDFLIEVVEPSGDVTTWALNVRTGAVSEYLNYDFNSFAQGHAGTYLGARADGLYELAGPDDAGAPIIADIISGLAAFSGSFLTGFKAAYLGLRGTGQFYLKLTSGDGKTYIYSVQADNLATARVNLGKGLRAKYFTFELISTGQDFDLTDVTFLPLQSTRRL